VVAKVAVVVAKAAYKYSGAQSIVSCLTDPHLSSCIQAAITVALVIGTGGTGEIADVAAEGAIDVAEDAGSAAAEDAAGAAAERAGSEAVEDPISTSLRQASEVTRAVEKQTEAYEFTNDLSDAAENTGKAVDDWSAALQRPPAEAHPGQAPLGGNPVVTAQGPTAAVHDPYATIVMMGAMAARAIYIAIKFALSRG
jgi:hypothetical protein